ncbi:MAG: dihydrodipicolinate synthase family protein [Cypionkella sp.]
MTRLNESAHGVYVIAVTPFHADGALDLESTDRMVDFYLEAGATGLTVLGMMGESQKLTIEESQLIVRRILQRVADRVPVVVGVSAPGFAQMAALTQMVMEDGAAGVMIAPPRPCAPMIRSWATTIRRRALSAMCPLFCRTSLW